MHGTNIKKNYWPYMLHLSNRSKNGNKIKQFISYL